MGKGQTDQVIARRKNAGAGIKAVRGRSGFSSVEQADEIPASIKQLKALQDVLGDLHDLHVAIGSVKALAQRRIRFEADERSREFLDAAQEGRPPRRTNSMLSGFGAIATALADRERASALELRDQWLREGTTTLFAKIDRAIEAVRRIGQHGQEIERKYLLSEKPVPTPGPRVVVSEIEQGYLPGAAGPELRRASTRAWSPRNRGPTSDP